MPGSIPCTEQALEKAKEAEQLRETAARAEASSQHYVAQLQARPAPSIGRCLTGGILICSS